MFQIIIGSLCFALSLIGYANVVEIAGFPRQLKWLVGVEIQILLLYFCAMVNLLKIGIWIVLLIGILGEVVRLFLVLSKKWQPTFEQERWHLYDLFMVLVGFWFIWQLARSPLIHYDNYSHWAVMVKYLYYQGHLPIAGDKIISFTSYLPGTSLYIDYFVNLVGFGSGRMLIGQFIIIWSALFTIFSVMPDHTRRLNQGILCLAIGLTMIANISIRTNNLLVDYVLACVTSAGFAGIWVLRDKAKLCFSYLFLTSSTLLLVKNSGPFFAAVLLIYALTQVKGAKEKLKELLSSALSFIPFGIWQWHVKAVFAAHNNHAINLSSYEKGTSTANWQQLGERVLHHLFNINTASSREWLLINIYGLVLWFVCVKVLDRKLPILRYLFGIDFIIAMFYLSLYWLYAASMTPSEARTLNGFERYMSTVIVIGILVMAMVTVVSIDRCLYEQNHEKRNLRSYSSIVTKRIYQLSTLVVFVFAGIAISSEINGLAFNMHLFKKEMPVRISKIAKEETHYNHHKILLLDAEKVNVDDDYDYYVGRYYFFSDKVTAREAFMMSNKEFKKYVNSFEYVALPVKHQTFQLMAKRVYHQNLTLGLYKVEKNKLVKVNKLN